jgi:hypothetical protein
MIKHASSLGYGHSGYYYAFYIYAAPGGNSYGNGIVDYYKIYMPVKKQ